MEDRGKLSFKEEENEDLREAKKMWESFLNMETEDKEKYFRALEIQFSLDSMAHGEHNEVKDAAAEVFTEKKMQEAQIPLRKPGK